MDPTSVPDLSDVPSGRTFLESHPDKPSPADPLYVSRFTTTHADRSRSHTIVGVHLVLSPGDPNGLWETLHVDRATQTLDPADPQVATRSVAIHCDTLEVRGELSIPEADVSIHVRRLLWATEDAAINTSPLPWAVPKARDATDSTPGEDGAAGRGAGGLQVFLSQMSPAQGARPRLVALGGPGQDPGAGLDGRPGTSMKFYDRVPFSIKDSGISTSRATVSFDPVAVYIDYRWKWGLVTVASGKLGENAFPGNGSDAVPPGIPGNGGDGGSLTTNLPEVLQLLVNAGGAAGTKERDYVGGPAGAPTSCARYDLTLAENMFGTNNAGYDRKRTGSSTSTRGSDALAQDAARGAGSTPEPVVDHEERAWLHPLGVQKTLEYARDLFLAGARVEAEELLVAYEAPLSLTAPDNGAWDAEAVAQWVAAQSEVAAMLQRLRGHLDYFGNPAGFTPFLSLQGSMLLYAEETKRALRALLLAAWVDARTREAKDAVAALGEAVTSLNDDSRQAAEQVTDSQARITDVTARMEALEQELGAMGNRLAILRNSLLSKAENDLRTKAQITFAIKMAAAVCQVVPVGQPALGAVGSLASVATGFIGGDATTAPDTVSQLGEVFTKAREAANKASEAAAKAAKERTSAPAKDTQSAQAGAAAWGTALDGVGPALSQVSQGLKALQVPQSEVEAQLQQLESQSEEWQDIVRDIRDLNEKKAALAADLTQAVQALGEGFGRISSNASAVFTMQQARGDELGRLNPTASEFVRRMAQQSRHTLVRYLYLMVKAYETTVLKPITVDWKLTEVADKINDLLKPEEGFDAAELNEQATALEPIFQNNLNAVRGQLLDDFSFDGSTIPLMFGLSGRQTPDLLESLNTSGAVTVDAVAMSLVLPGWQTARISNVALERIVFDPDGPGLEDAQNVIVSLQPASDGTLRKSEELYAVHSPAPPTWSWTCLASGQVRASRPTAGVEDMLDLLLGEGADRVKQKVSLPPVWSDLALQVYYAPPLPPAQRPRITQLYFTVSCDVTPAPAYQRVVNVRSMGAVPGAVIGCSPDLARRGDGFDSMYRIYSKGAQVRLSAPVSLAGSAFDAWDVIGGPASQVGAESPAVDIRVEDHVLALCHWRRLEAEMAPIVLERSDLEVVATASSPETNLLMRTEAAEEAPVVGLVPTLGDVDILDDRAYEDWLQVNWRGTVGWVRTDSADSTPTSGMSGTSDTSPAPTDRPVATDA